MVHILLVVEEVVGHVVASVSKDATAIRSCGSIPIPEDDAMCEFPEGRCKYDKQCGWHDQSVLVHGKVVVNAVEQEM